MLPLRRGLESIESGLETLKQKTRDMREMLDKLDEALALVQGKTKGKAVKRKSVRKSTAVRKTARETATAAVLKAIKTSRKGVTTDQIKIKTGFDERKIWGIVNRLKKLKKVKSAGRGIYIAT